MVGWICRREQTKKAGGTSRELGHRGEKLMGRELSWYWAQQAERAIKALHERGMEASFQAEPDAACEYILSRIGPGEIVGFGGSVTLVELGVLEALRRMDVILLDRAKKNITPAEKHELEERASKADVFLSGINALTVDGRLVFLDCYGNRVASILHGPARVLLVAGANKIEPTLERALWRVKEVAAPMNAHRLNRGTPCAVTGVCQDCRHEARVCNYTVIIEHAPRPGRFEVVLVGASLGL